MFDLVADVEKYPEFVPLCERLKVTSRRDDGEVTTLIADMTIAYKLVRETFRSRVRLDHPKLEIIVEYLDGPFQRMHNRWTFKPVGEDASEVRFQIDYEFRSRTLGVLMGAVFDQAFRRFAEAFQARADQLYGRKPGQPPASSRNIA